MKKKEFIENGFFLEKTSLISCYSDKVLWQDQVSGHATILTGNLRFTAFCCQGGSLYIYSNSGRKVLPFCCRKKKYLSIDIFFC